MSGGGAAGAESLRAAAEHEWLNQRVELFWTANGTTSKRRGVVRSVHWLDDASRVAAAATTSTQQLELLATRTLAASVLFDGDENACDNELVADLMHLSHTDDDDNDEFHDAMSTDTGKCVLFKQPSSFAHIN